MNLAHDPGRCAALALALALAGCAHTGTQVSSEEGVEIGAFRHIGVRAFTDPRGQGQNITDKINEGLQKALYETVDTKILEKILAQHKPTKESGMGVEATEMIRMETSADLVVAGRMSADWSAAVLSVIETSMGDEVAHALLKPEGGKKAFASADDVADEAVKVLTGKKK